MPKPVFAIGGLPGPARDVVFVKADSYSFQSGVNPPDLPCD